MDPTDFGIPQEKTTIPHLLHPTSHKLENYCNQAGSPRSVISGKARIDSDIPNN
jgi:hypothetical protein